MEKYVEKPWGCEVIWAETESYAAKLLFIKAGHILSLQYHQEKEESIIVSNGRIKFHWAEKEGEPLTSRVMTPGEHVDIRPGMIHRMEGIDNACVIEVSTPHLDDVVRLEDEYGRAE